ncbi:tectonic-1 [Falco biarmicus]|uniref:tectonic-1 n=1 Tax=Falco cherrug TaxID=345164 RepID=UPI002479BCB0|nr:tectonic-1 [Falco cherrug]XP_055565540.1 tectonic-1 [Falco cherrug]XP_055565546.1 tectonic-1 [Falco cherrug]XP_055565556.1 tectonic-1 [Falco cherrug]XP_056188311.1 tectonic-1 [Falco biarmicus]XP_056188318.1 tectonic-1 [Falco biarmicus]XP_056188326.1 tectonic-1 [Falco biarmicus]XP_056188334.1 tectonic-1 [Falco biarmicus]
MAAAQKVGVFLIIILLLLLPPLRVAEPSAEAAGSVAGPAAPPETGPAARARPRSAPAPVTDVAKLCVCDLLVAQCDVNCCCDPDCSADDFSLFTTCSVPIVTGDSRLCSQKAAVYSLDVEANPPERIFKLIDQVNPSVFCIHATNYEQALSFSSPEMPTSENFDQLLKRFGSAAFSAELDNWNMNTDAQNPSDVNETYRYEYGVPIQTVDAFLRLPSPVVSSWCSDANPAGFLVNQATKCTRSVSVEKCDNIQAVSMLFYISSSILAVPKSSHMVNITVQSIVVQSLNGMRTLLNSSDALRLPMISDELCINIVHGVSYHITYTDTGEIIEAAASFVLGVINKEVLSIQQSFEISFTQVNTKPVPLSGNPGYVVGLPIRAGFRPQGSGIIQNMNKYGQLTILQSTSHQDCLAAQGARIPILFGYNMISGCKLRITATMKCQPLAQTLLDLLKGQSFPEYVASFGNSQAQDVLDWVPITHLHTSEQSSCQIPVSLEIEVKWTKYGSLVNPQARIVNVTATITTTTLKQLPSGREKTIPITSSVVFTDISSPAEPGYKAWPTINVKLPFDFFFPFV